MFRFFLCFVEVIYYNFDFCFQYYNEFSKYSKKYYNRPSNSRYNNNNRKKKGLNNKTNIVKTSNVNAIQRQRKYNQKYEQNHKKILPTLVTVNELPRINKNALGNKKIIRKKTVK